MMLYHLLLTLEEKKIYSALHKTGVIPFSLNTSFQIYKDYLDELKVEKRKTQAAYNVSVRFNCAMFTVYKSINKMRQSVDVKGEISF